MGSAKPIATSCDNTVFTYLLEAGDVDAARAQIERIARGKPIVFIQTVREGKVELTVVAARLETSERQVLEALQQDDMMVQRIAQARFEASQVSFQIPDP